MLAALGIICGAWRTPQRNAFSVALCKLWLGSSLGNQGHSHVDDAGLPRGDDHAKLLLYLRRQQLRVSKRWTERMHKQLGLYVEGLQHIKALERRK